MKNQGHSGNRPLPSKWSPQPVIKWLFAKGRFIGNRNQFVHEFATRLAQVGAPIDRLFITLLTLNPQVVATSHNWIKSEGKTTPYEAEHQVLETDRYIGSPLQQLFDTQKRVRQRLDQLPEHAHGAFTELADSGFIDYLALPVKFGDTLGSAIIIATKRDSGFHDRDIQQFRKIRDFAAPILEVYALRNLSISLLNTYVGKRTSEKVLAGMIKRGDADMIHAALWFSDLRDFTQLTETLPSRQVLAMLNAYFELVSAAVTAHRGEILRFIGDAMLIVFPIDDHLSQKYACESALDAAIDAQAAVAALNHRRRRHNEPEIKFGIGLNVGEVAYGNVGAPDRLDFTVMGPVVNRTARLESLTKQLAENILFSQNFADLIEKPSCFLGLYAMKGIAQPQAVFALKPG